ncbi:putative facilitator of salicylate uptake, partial [hydrothermal vent metagenome]
MKHLKTYFLYISIVLISLSFPYDAQATNAMKLIGIGPVQRAMGGASVGLPLDSATTITNPAGISRLSKRVDFGVSYFSPNPKYSATGPQITTNNKVVKTNGNSFVIPAFGMVMPWNDKWSYGFGAYGVGGMGVDYASNLFGNVTYTEYAFLKFAPAVAYSFNDRLTFGFAPNGNWASMNFNAGAPGTPHSGGSAYGIGFTAGFLYDVSDVLTIGLAYESQQWFQDFEFNTTSGRDALHFDQPQSAT